MFTGHIKKCGIYRHSVFGLFQAEAAAGHMFTL